MSGLQRTTIEDLDGALSFAKKGAWHSGKVKAGAWDGKTHMLYLQHKKATDGTFPFGLLSRVKQWLREGGHRFKVYDHRKKKPPKPDFSVVHADMLEGVSMSGKYDYQLDVTKTALKKKNGILWLATNAGKTEIASAMIKAMPNHVCLVVVPTKKLMYDTRARIAKRLGVIEQEIGCIGDGKFFPAEVTVAVVNSLYGKRGGKKRQNAVRRYLKMVQCVFLDEGHHARSTTWYRMMKLISNAAYRYVLSGTPFGSGNALMVEGCVGPVIARITNAELIERGVSAIPFVRMMEIHEPDISEISREDWARIHDAGIIDNAHRNHQLARWAAACHRRGRPTMVLVDQLYHGDQIRQQLKLLDVPAEFVHGRMPVSAVETCTNDFEEDKDFVLIASPIFGEGVDIPTVEALIMADAGKSTRKVLQQIGRGLRKKDSGRGLLVLDCADLTHEVLSEHSLERFDIYVDEGFEVETVEDVDAEGEEGKDVEGRAEESRAEVVPSLPREDVVGRARRTTHTTTAIQERVGLDSVGVHEGGARLRWHRRAA